MNARSHAMALMSGVVEGRLEVERFCAEYEQHFNFNWPSRGEEPDLRVFQALFDVVVFFTPFPEEKETAYPGYRTAPEIIDAVKAALVKLRA